MVLTLQKADSLALSNSPDIVSAREELKSIQAKYKTALLSFVPSLEITGSIPSIDYYSDEVFYPSYPEPLNYWQKINEKYLSTELSMSLPFGGDASLSYDLLKRNEEYNLYTDREFYQGDLGFDISMPLFGTSDSWDRLKNLRRSIRETEVNLDKIKRETKEKLRKNYVTASTGEKILKKIDELGEIARRGLEELDYLKEKGVIDRIEYLRSKSKMGQILLRKSELKGELRESRKNIKFLTGVDSLDLTSPEIPEIRGEPVPDIYFQLKKVKIHIRSLKDEISTAKRSLAPSLNLSGYYGLRGKDGNIGSVIDLGKNKWGVSVGITVPIFKPQSFGKLSTLNYRMNSLKEEEKKLEKRLEIEKENLLQKSEELKQRVKLAEMSYRASTMALESLDPELLGTHERLEMLEDYLETADNYGRILQEILTLNVKFKEKGSKEQL